MRKKKRFVRQSLDQYHESQIPKLAGTLFRGTENGSAETISPRVFAVTSPQASEGVTTISLLIARELARHPERQALLASTAELARMTHEDLQDSELRWTREPLTDLWRLTPIPGRPSAAGRAWETDPRFVRELLSMLRRRFGVVILDCGPLLSSSDLPKLGHLVDGAIVVIEAGRSTRPQIEHALQVLSLGGTELRGFVLNRRSYPIPERIYRWLRS